MDALREQISLSLCVDIENVKCLRDSAGMLSNMFVLCDTIDGTPLQLIKTDPTDSFALSICQRMSLQQRESDFYSLSEAIRHHHHWRLTHCDNNDDDCADTEDNDDDDDDDDIVLLIPRAQSMQLMNVAATSTAHIVDNPTLDDTTTSQMLLIEHLCPKGFQARSLGNSLSKDEVELCLKALAHFHVDFAVPPLHQQALGIGGAITSSFGVHTDSQWFAEMIFDSGLADLRRRGDGFLASDVVDAIANARDVIIASLVCEVDSATTVSLHESRRSSFTSLSYGDLWSPNILFSSSSSSRPAQVAFIDFQFVRHDIPAIDVFFSVVQQCFK